MGKVRPAEPVLLFMGTLYSDAGIFNYSKEIIEKNFGDILLISPSIKWDHSSYYKDELGWPLFRQFIFLKNLIDPGMLAQIKLKTNEIEDALSSKGKRCINLDPGYLTLSKIVLASTKNYAHRIYLGKGVYGEVTLVYVYKDSTYTPHLFTYRDYQDKTCIEMFLNVRAMLKKMLS
ncbi:MAG: hypothetical protein A2Z47_06000 [Thermodesulfovibrio sp. RBG_19FT_COMBO_42_12]|nr:MAG: hypothetical protein A2Z47_06000 [Thermodesulfovibrio sp. RBG_19FT_COMBO_42_12]